MFSRTILPYIRATQDYKARRMGAVWDQSVRLSTTFPLILIIFHRGESIADHMYRMALMTMVAPPSLAPRLDFHKCMKMCLIHDLAESFVGDLTPADGVAKTEKSRRESTTMDYITQQLLGNVRGAATNVGEDIRAVWQEHEDSETLESRFVQDIDKVELLLQMVEYEKRGEGKVDLKEFTYVATKVSLPETKPWVEEILEEREKFWSNKKLVHEKTEEGGTDASSDMRKMQDIYYDGQ
jgi:putative hydrolase of HD superfamily